MLGDYFYHEIFKKTTIGFGTLFNNIRIVHKNPDGTNASMLKVPLAYGPIQKFLARIEQQPDLAGKSSLTLPRMSFEMRGLQYDATRKSSITQNFSTTKNNGNKIKVYMPVPYNVQYELNIITKLNDDSLQIIEQILPYFQPSLNITIDFISSIGEKKDVPIQLENISFQDNYVGSFDDRRYIIHTLLFTAKTSIFGPVADSTEGLIKKVQVDYGNLPSRSKTVRYSVTPEAKQDYNSDNVINTVDDALVQPGDDFGFNEEFAILEDL